MIRCHMCRRDVDSAHAEYAALCPECGEENIKQRDAACDLTGYRIIVNGARIKIGHQTALRLLRHGAEVLATSRFPELARQEFAAQTDYADWADRLHLAELDLLRLDLIEAFLDQVFARWDGLEALINNTAPDLRGCSHPHHPALVRMVDR